MTINTTIVNSVITLNTLSSPGTISMNPFNVYFVNSSSVTLTLPTNPQIGDTYEIHTVATSVIINAPDAPSTQVILWENSGYSTLTSSVAHSASIEIVYMGLLFSGKQTFIAKSTNTVIFTPS